MKKRRVLFISHVLPGRPSAGNEIRIRGMVEHLQESGFEVHFIYIPNRKIDVKKNKWDDAKSYIKNLYMIRSWTLKYDSLVASMMRHLEKDLPARLVEFQDHFCNVNVVGKLHPLINAINPDIVIAEYIFATRAFFISPQHSLKVIDLHDLFSTKMDKVVKFGIQDILALTADEEKLLVDRADLAIAIQEDEAKKLQQMKVEAEVISWGVAPSLVCPKKSKTHAKENKDPTFLFVASDNALNQKGLEDFLTLCWPAVRKKLPTAKFNIAGRVKIAPALLKKSQGVKAYGFQKDLAKLYHQSDVILNPVYAGTGLKIKTVEALFHHKPLVTWPNGVDGLKRFTHHEAWVVAHDWKSFAKEAVRVASDAKVRSSLSKKSMSFLKSYTQYMSENSLSTRLNQLSRKL